MVVKHPPRYRTTGAERLEQYTGFGPVLSVWKTDVLAADTNTASCSFWVFCLGRKQWKTPSDDCWLVYWVIGIFFRFILPSLSRRCLAHLVGTHSPRLHFCREPIGHLTSVGGNHPYMSVAAQPCASLGDHTRYEAISQPEYYPLSRRFIGTDLCINTSQAFLLRLTHLRL